MKKEEGREKIWKERKKLDKKYEEEKDKELEELEENAANLLTSNEVIDNIQIYDSTV